MAEINSIKSKKIRYLCYIYHHKSFLFGVLWFLASSQTTRINCKKNIRIKKFELKKETVGEKIRNDTICRGFK